MENAKDIALEPVKDSVRVLVKGGAEVVVKAHAVEPPKDITNTYSYCLYSGISSDKISPLIEYVKNLEYGATLNLYINSKGGVVPVAIGVYNYIRSIKGLKVNTYNMGHCDSAATLLFMLGEKRYVTKNSSFYMHSLQIRLPNPQTISALKSELLNLTEDTKNFINLLSESSDISKKQWQSWMSDKGTMIKYKKAITKGIANIILEENTKI